MSAFIVSEKTMSRCVDALTLPHGHYREDVREGTAFAGLDVGELGRKLYALNVRAVDGRYQESNPIPFYRHLPAERVPMIAYYKALRCLRYQCSEEATIDDPMMGDLDKAIGALAGVIVGELPEWDAAEWDAP